MVENGHVLAGSEVLMRQKEMVNNLALKKYLTCTLSNIDLINYCKKRLKASDKFTLEFRTGLIDYYYFLIIGFKNVVVLVKFLRGENH